MIKGFEMRRSSLLGGAALLALALSVGAPSAAYAQDAQTQPDEEEQDNSANPAAPPNAASAEPGEGEEIVVTGFRASLENAVAEKKNRDQVVESVSAEDIGKLPDASIAESIARLPGLTSQRLSGRANVISIRGFGPDFSTTLLNGREQTTTGENRAVEFDQYPSEVVRQVVVYKSPTASLIGQGLVGTVDIRTIRPLDFGGKQVLAIGARGSYSDLGKLNAGSKDLGYRVNATFVDQFADDTLGVAVAASYVNEPYQIQEFNAWGYNNINGNALIGGSKSYVTSTELKRIGVQGTLQFRPTDALTFTLDGFYSNFKDDQIKRGIELPLGFFAFGTQLAPGSRAEDGQIVEGTFTTVEGVLRNDAFQRHADLYSFGFNANWDSGDGWSAFFDASYSRTDRNELILESYSGTGYGAFNAETNPDEIRDTIGFRSTTRGTVFDPSLNYSDPNLIRLTDPLGWGGSRVQAGYYNNRLIDDELKQFRGELEREAEGFFSAFKVGANYTTRDKALTPDEAFLVIASGANEAELPAEYRLRPTNLDYLGLGPILSYNPLAVLDGGIYRLEANTAQDVLGKGYTVEEDLLSFYAQADFEAETGDNSLTGNFGVQAIRTDQSSTGFVFGTNGPELRTLGDKFWDVLPSLNISMRTPGDLVVRFAARREIQRPRLDQMRLSIGYGVDRSINPAVIRGGGGNPFLRPFRANSVDFNVEKYFGRTGYIAFQLFYKDLINFVFDNVERPFDYTGLPEPTGGLEGVPSRIGTISQPANVGGGKLYGWELAGTVPFEVVTPALDGFGFTGGLAYTNTEVRRPGDPRTTEIQGYSRWVANGTLYYEKAGFSARASARHRSTFLGELSAFGGQRTNRRALGETIIDAQIGYDFQDGSAFRGLSIFLQGQNLTDEPFVTVTNPETPLQVIDHQSYGRRFLAGFNYKF